MEEIWKDIKGYEGLYQVSNLGRVRSLDRVVKQICGRNKNKFQYNHYKGYILIPYIRKDGYTEISLSKHKKQTKFLLHRLVAITFLEQNNLPEVNHIDENKQNNCVTNLEWCTAKYNSNYGNRAKKFKNSIGIKILEFDLNNNFIKRYESIIDISRERNIPYKKIYRRINTEKSLNGLKWKYETSE